MTGQSKFEHSWGITRCCQSLVKTPRSKPGHNVFVCFLCCLTKPRTGLLQVGIIVQVEKLDERERTMVDLQISVSGCGKLPEYTGHLLTKRN